MKQQPGTDELDRLYEDARAQLSADSNMDRLYDEAREANALGVVGSIREGAQAFAQGAVNTVSEGLRGAGKLADAMRSAAPWMSALDVGEGQSALSAGGEQVGRLAPDVDPRVANTTVGGIASGLGQVTGLMGIGALSPVAAAETAFLGGVSETERQVAAEMTDEDHGAGLGTLLAGGAIGAADMIPVGGVLARINRVMGGKLAVAGLRLAELQKIANSGGALATAGRIAETTALEAGTEALQKVATNGLVNYATDQELDLMRGVLPEGGMGGAVGGILASVVELATAKRRGMAVRAAKLGVKLEEYRIRRETDPVFRQNEEAALNDMIAAEYGVKLTEPVTDGEEAIFSTAQEGSAVAQAARGQVGTPVAPAIFDDTQGNLYNDPVEGMRVLSNPGPEENPRPSRPARVTEAEAMASQTVEEPPRYADGTLYEEGMRPNPAEYSRRSPGIPEGSQAPTSPAAASGEQATQPPTPASSVRAAPSAAAYTPVPDQHGPGGAPVVAITGSREGMLWGGTQENTIGAKLPTSLSDIGRALLDFGRSLGDLSISQRMNTASGIGGSFTAGGALDFSYNDVMTGAHEVGHIIHRWLMANQRNGAQVATNPNATLDGLPPQVQGEISGLAYPGHAPGRALSEGFAELARLWLLAPEAARKKAPNASRWLENWIVSQPRDVGAALAMIQERAQNWRFQGDPMRSSVGTPPTFTQKAEVYLRALPEKVVRRIYDDTAALKKLDPKLQSLWRSIRGTARGMLTNFVSGVPADFNGNAIEGGINFEKVMRGVAQRDRHLFDNYIVARMSLALEGKGVSVGKAPAEARRLVDELDRTHPQFASTLDGLTQWWAQINRVLADASPTYQAGMDRIAEHDAKYGIDIYAPLHRWLQTEQGQAWGKTNRRSNTNPVSRERSGGEQLVKSPTEAFVNEARSRLEQAVYRNLVESLVGVFDATGGNNGDKIAYMREITAEDAGGKQLDFGPEGSVDSLLSALGSPEMQGDLVTVKALDRAGNVRFFRMDRRIAELAAQVDPATLRNGLGFWMRAASRSRRVLSTTQIVYNFGFQFFTNLALDVPMAYLAPSYFKWNELHELAGYTAQNVLNNVRAAFMPMSAAPKWVAAYERLGLHGSAGLSGETQIGRTVTNLSGGRSTIDKMWQGVAAFMSIPQRSVQIALMQKAAKLYKIDITQPITADEANILRLAARQPVDYNAGGDLSRKWQLFVPFLRPALDSERQLAESMRRNPIEFFAKAGVLAALYSSMRYLFADDELEKRKSGADVFRSITIPAGGGEAIELRVPGEIAWLTLAPIALYQAMEADGQDASELALGAVRNMLPPFVFSNPLLNTALQQATNRSNPIGGMFDQTEAGPLVPNALQGMEGLAQRTPATAPVAIAFANMAHTVLAGVPEGNPFKEMASSPIRWESAIRSLLGSNGLAAVEGWAVIPGLKTPVEPELADGILQGIFRRNGTASWNDRYIREVFELNRIAMQQKATLNGQYEDPMDAMRRESLARTAAALAQARFLTTYDNASMSVERRREMARMAQKVASDTIKALKDGKMPTAFYGLEAETRGVRTMYDLNRGAFWK